VSLKRFKVAGFRCLDELEIQPDRRLNLITGPNASGKTSLLESIFYLGRGRSFRASGNRELIQTGSKGFVLFGETADADGNHRVGVEVAIGQREVRADGESGNGADLARLLPVQVIDPEIHELIQGSPELRRRFLDWGVFHVKHSFLDAWRRYRKALSQRNAALRQGDSDAAVFLWNEALVEHGEAVDRQRGAFIEQFNTIFAAISKENLSFSAICVYKRGWPEKTALSDALQTSIHRDRVFGSTQVGPHRADLSLSVADRRARHRVSRGQQKMLAAALVIAQTRFVAAQVPSELVLLVDDPAAELDRDNRERLFQMLHDIPAQMFVTALEAEDLPWSAQGQMFHVEHGKVTSLL
jgi:DNA replication and repair protein RecF